MIFRKKKNAFSVSQLVNVALAEVCGSTVEKGGVAGAEFSADVTFSQWFCSLINVCSSLQSLLCLCERNAVLKGKIAFESCNSVFVGEKKKFYFGGGGGGGERWEENTHICSTHSIS